MKRVLSVLQACSLLAALGIVAYSVPIAAHDRVHGTFDLVEATIPAIQHAVDHDIITTQQLVRMYLKRIVAYNGKATATHLNAYIFQNPRALQDADDDHDGNGDRDDDRDDRDGRSRPLRGIPMILKDNVDTRDMPTTAGSV